MCNAWLRRVHIQAAKNYTMIKPPTPKDAARQGGLWVFDGSEVLFARKDEATGDHTEMEAVKSVTTTCNC